MVKNNCHVSDLMEGMNCITRNNVYNFHCISMILNQLKTHFYESYIHSVKVAGLSASIGKRMNMGKEEIDKLYLCGLLHDVGKVKISKEILGKNGALTEEEYNYVKKHPAEGYIMVCPYVPQEIANVIYSHHERLDGSGYPLGLGKEELSEKTRIVMIADVYEAMTAERVYHHKISSSEALQELKKWKEEKYDEVYFKVLTEVVGK